MISSGQECAEVIRSAKAALEVRGNFFFGNEKIENELVELNLLSRSERYMAVEILLDEISFASYQGPAPPNDVCSHPPYRGSVLHAFCLNSASLGKRVYFKFSVVSGKSGASLALYALHPPRN